MLFYKQNNRTQPTYQISELLLDNPKIASRGIYEAFQLFENITPLSQTMALNLIY